MANKALETLSLAGTSYDVKNMLVVTASSVSSLPLTITNAAIESSMCATKMELSYPLAQLDKWTVTPSNGKLVISGSIQFSTTIKLYLEYGKAV